MMEIVTGCWRASPLDFRANPQIRGTARRPHRRVTTSESSGTAPSKTLATRRRRMHAKCAVITALIGAASSVVGSAQLPATTWPRSGWAHAAANERMQQVTAGTQTGASCARDLWKLPTTFNAIATSAAWQKPAVDEAYAAERCGRGRSDSGTHGAGLTAWVRPAPLGDITPDPQIPAATAEPLAPPPATPPPRAQQPLSPPRQPAAPAPQPEAPAPPPEAPPPQPPPRGHVQLAP